MKICLDSNCVIYLVENNPVWSPKIVARLARATAAGDTLAVCDLARSECLIGPLKGGDAAVLADYQRFFTSPAVEMLPLNVAVCERAAELRVLSALRLELPDCLHLAAALEHGCGLFLTNDARLAICSALAVEILTCILAGRPLAPQQKRGGPRRVRPSLVSQPVRPAQPCPWLPASAG